MNFETRKANLDDLERIWDMNISDNAGDDRWIAWKNVHIIKAVRQQPLLFYVHKK